MSEYIKREDAVSVCRILADKMDDVGFTAVSQCIGAIKDIYAADVVEVRHGELLDAHPYGCCSLCGFLIDVRDDFNYCPFCGADLRGDT